MRWGRLFLTFSEKTSFRAIRIFFEHWEYTFWNFGTTFELHYDGSVGLKLWLRRGIPIELTAARDSQVFGVGPLGIWLGEGARYNTSLALMGGAAVNWLRRGTLRRTSWDLRTDGGEGVSSGDGCVGGPDCGEGLPDGGEGVARLRRGSFGRRRGIILKLYYIGLCFSLWSSSVFP